MSHTSLHMGLRWVTNGSCMCHTLVSLPNTTFLIFFLKLNKLWPRHYSTTLQTRKMNVIFDQSEGSNPVVSLLPFCDALQGVVFCTLGYEIFFDIPLLLFFPINCSNVSLRFFQNFSTSKIITYFFYNFW